MADWDKIAWFGFSVESPQINFPSNSIGIFTGPQAGTAASQNVTAATAIGGAIAPPGLTINDLNACQAGGLLYSTTSCSLNHYPDLVENFALIPVGVIMRWSVSNAFLPIACLPTSCS